MVSRIAGIIMSVKIDDLTITYDHHPAIHHLNAEIQNGDWLAVVGPKGWCIGCGRTRDECKKWKTLKPFAIKSLRKELTKRMTILEKLDIQ